MYGTLVSKLIVPAIPWLAAASLGGIAYWQRTENVELRTEVHQLTTSINGDEDAGVVGYTQQIASLTVERDRYKANAEQYETQNGALQALNATLTQRADNLNGQLRHMRAQLSLDLAELSRVPTTHECISSPPVRLVLEQLRREETPGEPGPAPSTPDRSADTTGIAVRLASVTDDAELVG
jgi:hypothetical protein